MSLQPNALTATVIEHGASSTLLESTDLLVVVHYFVYCQVVKLERELLGGAQVEFRLHHHHHFWNADDQRVDARVYLLVFAMMYQYPRSRERASFSM